MTTERARDAPGRSPRPQRVDGLLTVDLEGKRAKYECSRSTCPKRLEGPITAARHGVDELRAFVAEVKHVHMAAFHKENDR
ncbi:hypothetical protein [Streptomyces brasiliscabiei]|uniref:hypothetical protein n=1 Tax=Streptomyces brasiliscabiei TaxID=2736302 RepID=UPI0038F71AAD